MHIFDENIKKLGLNIPEPPDAVANYIPFKIINNLMYVSGQAPLKDGQIAYKGKVGVNVTISDGIKAAELCCINIILLCTKVILLVPRLFTSIPWIVVSSGDRRILNQINVTRMRKVSFIVIHLRLQIL